MVKLDTSVESLIVYRDQGWRFSVKTVNGKKYITIRRKREKKSLGPYSDETWRLIGEIDIRRVKGAESLSNRLEASQRVTEVDASEAIVGLGVVKVIKAFSVDSSDVLGA